MVFSLSSLLWKTVRGLWMLPDGRDWLKGKLGLVLMGWAMLSKFNPILRWKVELCSLPVVWPDAKVWWRLTSLKISHAGTATLSAPSPTAGHRWPKPLPEAPGHSRVSVCTAAATAAAKSLQSCPTLCDPIDGSPQGSRPWDSPGKNNGVGCHFLFQCMKVKSESEVAQSCLTLSDPMDCSLPGYSIHGIFQARVL